MLAAGQVATLSEFDRVERIFPKTAGGENQAMADCRHGNGAHALLATFPEQLAGGQVVRSYFLSVENHLATTRVGEDTRRAPVGLLISILLPDFLTGPFVDRHHVRLPLRIDGNHQRIFKKRRRTSFAHPVLDGLGLEFFFPHKSTLVVVAMEPERTEIGVDVPAVRHR